MTNNKLSTMTIEKVIEKARVYLHNEENIDKIKKAYNIAYKYHEGQFRKSGDPYIIHPLEVCYMLTDLSAGPNTICAGMLHDTVEDTPYTLDECCKDLGEDVASIVDGVTKIGKLKYMTKQKALAKSHEKILVAMAKDIRVILVKLVDRVHNMRTLQFKEKEKQLRISKETLDLYAPLAHRLGMYRIKSELEDLSFKYIDIEKYNQLNKNIKDQIQIRGADLDAMEDKIEGFLKENKISGYKITSRVKGIFSVNNKMQEKKKAFHQIYDLLALRIVVNSIEECYRVLGLVHSIWNPIPTRFKDYIATPKPNLYQSLHTTVVGIGGNIYEIQIRTYEMDSIAELGVAAHWAYKEEDKNYTPQKEQQEIFSKLRWYKDLTTYLEIGAEDGHDPVSTLQDEVFNASVYVFTPKGDVLDFPKGATPLDFAYRIHTEVGNHTVGAIINSKIVPLTYQLQTGDVIQIKTNKSFNGPTETWIKIVKTNHARHKISAILNKRKRDIYIEKGMSDFDAYMKLQNSYEKLNDKFIEKNFSKFGINNLDEFYFQLGKGTLSIKGAFNRMYAPEVESTDAIIKQYVEKSRVRKTKASSRGVIVDGLDKAHVKLAACCHPVLGDPIVGFVSRGKGIVVHHFECPNTVNVEDDRFIDVCWDNDSTPTFFESVITILSFNRRTILNDIVNTLNSSSISIGSIINQKTKSGELLTKVKLYTKDADTLEVAMINLKKISDVYNVERKMR